MYRHVPTQGRFVHFAHALGKLTHRPPGYAHERMALVKFLGERRVANPVVLTGDIHTNRVDDLRVDDRKAQLPVVATEFVGTSITSGGNGVDRPASLDSLPAENPCVRFHKQQRGYVRCTVTSNVWRSDYLVVENVTQRNANVSNRASFVVESGKPGAKLAGVAWLPLLLDVQRHKLEYPTSWLGSALKRAAKEQMAGCSAV